MSSDCGCYDGPYMEGSDIMVSVRCAEHSTTPPLAGHGLMERMKTGEVKGVAPRDIHSARDLSLAKQRKTNAQRARGIRSTGNTEV